MEESASISASEEIFFPVSLKKLFLMSIGTFTLYYYVWIFKNFKWLEVSSGKRFFPLVSCIFYPITFMSLVAQTNRIGADHGVKKIPFGIGLGILFFLITALGNAPEPFFWIAALNILPVLILQKHINEINKKAGITRINNHMGVVHWLFVAPGFMCFVFLMLVSILAPEALKQ